MVKFGKLPSWAKISADGEWVEVDPEVMYPVFLNAMGFDHPSQHRLEACRRAMTTALKDFKSEGDLKIRILAGDKGWALKNHPEGDPADFESWRAKYDALRNSNKIPD